MPKKPDVFKVENPPFKSKRLPKSPPHPLPQIENGAKLCMTLAGRRLSGKSTMTANLIRAYAKSVTEVLVFSPSILGDPVWDSIKDIKNVFFHDVCNNDILLNLLQKQRQSFDRKKPKENQILVVIDDFGAELVRKDLLKAMGIYYSTCRHAGINLIVCLQSVGQLNNTLKGQSSQWLFWQCNIKSLKKVCQELATRQMDEDQMEKFIWDNTEEPYSFVYMNMKAEPITEMFRVGFDKIYDPKTGQTHPDPLY